MVRARGIAGRRTDPEVFFPDDVLHLEIFRFAEAAEFALFLVHQFGEGLGEAVAQGLGHDRAVVVLLGLKRLGEFLDAVAGGDGETAEVIGAPGGFGRDVIGEAVVELAGGFFVLLAQVVEGLEDGFARFVGVELDAVADGVGRPEADDGAGGVAFFRDDLFEHRLRVGVELGGFGADDFVRQNIGEAPVEFPGGEKRSPVDVFGDFGEREVLGNYGVGGGTTGERGGAVGGEHAQTEKLRLGNINGRPIDGLTAVARLGEREHLARAFAVGEFDALLLLLGARFRDEGGLAVGVEQLRDHADHARGVEHVDDGLGVMGRDLDRVVGGRGGGAADEQRDLETLALHFLGVVDHLVERGRDEPGEPDDVGTLFFRGGENLFARHHDAEIDDLVIVTGEDDADDVLADVVHVALHGRHDDAALSLGGAAGRYECGFFRLHKRLEVGDGFLHDAGGFHDLREKHFTGAEEVADDAHAVHERSFDDEERLAVFYPRFFGVHVDELVDAFDQRVRETLFDGALAPGLLDLDVGGLGAGLGGFEFFAEFYEALGGVGAAVEDHIFDEFEQFFVHLFVDLEHRRVDDAHVHAGLDGVVEERRVHGLAHGIVAAETEGDV